MQKWSELLSQNSLQKAAALSEKAQSERDAGRTIYPPQPQIFRALRRVDGSPCISFGLGLLRQGRRLL